VIHREWHDTVLLVTIDRQERRNAVDHGALEGLLQAIEVASSARAVVLTGAGDHAFCAGADLTGVENADFAELLSSVLTGFGALACPVIAAVHGAALGAGMQLASACDLRVATADSRFGIPAARLGLAIDWWTVRRLAAEAGHAVARGMLVGTQTYSGEQLAASGFVHRLGGRDDALGWAAELATLAPLTLAAHKRGLEALVGPPPDPAFEAARLAAWRSADAVEGRAAFLEKRPARFTGQ
jgi:enoyl-CoA hydratase